MKKLWNRLQCWWGGHLDSQDVGSPYLQPYICYLLDGHALTGAVTMIDTVCPCGHSHSNRVVRYDETRQESRP